MNPCGLGTRADAVERLVELIECRDRPLTMRFAGKTGVPEPLPAGKSQIDAQTNEQF